MPVAPRSGVAQGESSTQAERLLGSQFVLTQDPPVEVSSLNEEEPSPPPIHAEVILPLVLVEPSPSSGPRISQGPGPGYMKARADSFETHA